MCFIGISNFLNTKSSANCKAIPVKPAIAFFLSNRRFYLTYYRLICWTTVGSTRLIYQNNCYYACRINQIKSWKNHHKVFFNIFSDICTKSSGWKSYIISGFKWKRYILIWFIINYQNRFFYFWTLSKNVGSGTSNYSVCESLHQR